MKPNDDGDSYQAFRARWLQRRDDARGLYSDEEISHLIEVLLDEVEAMRLDELREDVDLPTAARLSGYHESTLSRMVERGELTNTGGYGRPRFRVVDLPYKAGRAQMAALRCRVLGDQAPAVVPTAPRVGESVLALVDD